MDIENSKYGSVQRGLIAEDLLKFSWADEITLSPNGQTVAYTVKQPHSDSNGYMTGLGNIYKFSFASSSSGPDVGNLTTRSRYLLKHSRHLFFILNFINGF